MNFNFPLLKPVRIILFPFSLLYYLIIFIRNKCYDFKLFPTSSFALPVICVGNIAAGGTGKSPMVEFLLQFLSRERRLATLSRGYKRKTRGYVLANGHTNALDIGDEPMQFYLKFPDVAVAVGEDRVATLPQLLHDHPETECVILDDAFQHRSISAGWNILLTDFNNLYTRDWYLPTGDLRDEKRRAREADMVVVTKCPGHLSRQEADAIREELSLAPGQALFFSTIHYGELYHITDKQHYKLTPDVEVLLVTGIANPRPLKKLLNDHCRTYEELTYSDHHIFSIDDLREIRKRFQQLTGKYKIILTTEKDAVRLIKFRQELHDMPLFVIPIEMQFLFHDTERFTGLIGKFIKEFSAQS
ncbi:tetraacyldisaccharide 4'-kinase [Flavihumibacter petaseus]|uniref:Tetraacyldisaccharide 4'-kinase n=1 Tax=Flavihumibacter petaseus NBRC 106054 TaxID=1220578 RepID=A0A0E9N463_9BACT|nr:tetraacyldisaccharide 4'-kinase [Flavihumibacter petaseus]GAO44578.1 tetraacyldisaccharide 4'-kinase [Flavihumibacter petaseus NBRC 106054]